MADETTTTTEATPANAESAAADAATEASTEAAKTDGADAEEAAPAGTETASGEPAKVSGKQAAQAIKDAPNTEAGAEQVADALASAPAEDLPQLEALAKKLGFVINGTEVTSRERAAFRQHQKNWSNALQQEKQKALQEIAAERSKYTTDIEWAAAVKAAKEANDLDGLAKALGEESWEALQKTAIERMADPHYKRLQELERKQKEIEEREAQAQERARKEQAQREQAARRQNYLARLSTKMAESEIGLVKEFHNDPAFLQQIEAIQLAHWDDDRRTTVSPEQAINMAGPNGAPPLIMQLKGYYDRLHRVFGQNGGGSNGSAAAVPAPAASTAPATDKKTKAPGKTQVVKGSPVEAAGAAEWTDDKEYTKNWIKAMQEAIEKDRSEGKGLGG